MCTSQLEEVAAHRLARPALEEDIVRHHDGRTAIGLEHGPHVLEEVELLVGGGGPEVLAAVGQGLPVGPSPAFSLVRSKGWLSHLAAARQHDSLVGSTLTIIGLRLTSLKFDW